MREPEHAVGNRELGCVAARAPSAASGRGSVWRSRASPRACSRRAGSRPSGRGAARGSSPGVRGADEQHLREVEGQIQISPVAGIPFGIEDLEHRGRQDPPEVGPHLVDLVDQEHRVGPTRRRGSRG